MNVPCWRSVELVAEGLARLDRALRQAADAVHAVGHVQAVEVHRGRRGRRFVT
jgi:hypothetical protein